MSRTRYKVFESTAVHFMTCSVVDWLPILARLEPKEFIIDSFRFLQDEDAISVFAYVIMENHLHLIAQADNLYAEIGRFKSFTARCTIDFLKAERNFHFLKKLKANKLDHHKDSTYQFWQESSHPEQIQGRKMMVQKIEYIHNNPVRRGYVELPEHWKYSSARNYLGVYWTFVQTGKEFEAESQVCIPAQSTGTSH